MYRSSFAFVLAMTALAAILLPSFSHAAQITFQRTYGDTGYNGALSVRQTTDGGFIITGYTQPLGVFYYDVYLMKTDAYGDTLWTRTFGGAGSDVGYSVEQTVDGGYVVAGDLAWGGGADDVFLLKTDAGGNTLWTRRYGGSDYDDGSWVQQTADRGFIITGLTYSSGSGESDVYLIRTDTSGYPVWTQTFGGGNWDEGWTVQQTADGGFIISCYTNSFGAGRYDVLLIKTDADGNGRWTKTFGGTGADFGFQVQQTADSGFIIVGYTTPSAQGSTTSISSERTPQAIRSGREPSVARSTTGAIRSNRPLTAVSSSQASPTPSVQAVTTSISSRQTPTATSSGP